MEHCVMCGLPKDQVDKLVEINEEVYICNRCTAELNSLFARSYKTDENETYEIAIKIYPKEIKAFLDEYVIGQDQAKKVLAVEIYNHFNRINNKEKEIQKNNILMVGKSGVGKTLLVQTLAKLLDLPLSITDCTQLSQSGYKGADSEDILKQLILAADGDIEKAQNGIIFLDEFDKLAKRNLTSSTDKDPAGEGVQFEMLRMIEGHKYQIKQEGVREKKSSIDTTNILFICSGAFSGLDKIIEKNQQQSDLSIGFSANVIKKEVDEFVEITEEDLIEYGIITEVVSRLHVCVKLNDLTKEDYRKILIEPKNSVIKQYQNLLSLDGFELEFSETFIDETIEQVYNSKKGARGLKSVVEKRMRDIIYNIDQLDDTKIVL